MTSYMTCAPTVFVVIMIREINSKDEQGNANITAIHNNHDVDAATETSQYSQTIYVSRPLGPGNRRSSSSRTVQ